MSCGLKEAPTQLESGLNCEYNCTGAILTLGLMQGQCCFRSSVYPCVDLGVGVVLESVLYRLTSRLTAAYYCSTIVRSTTMRGCTCTLQYTCGAPALYRLRTVLPASTRPHALVVPTNPSTHLPALSIQPTDKIHRSSVHTSHHLFPFPSSFRVTLAGECMGIVLFWLVLSALAGI